MKRKSLLGEIARSLLLNFSRSIIGSLLVFSPRRVFLYISIFKKTVLRVKMIAAPFILFIGPKMDGKSTLTQQVGMIIFQELWLQLIKCLLYLELMMILSLVIVCTFVVGLQFLKHCTLQLYQPSGSKTVLSYMRKYSPGHHTLPVLRSCGRIIFISGHNDSNIDTLSKRHAFLQIQ